MSDTPPPDGPSGSPGDPGSPPTPAWPSPRRPAGNRRIVAAISTAGPAMPAPPAARIPIAKTRPAVVVMNGVRIVPSATSMIPASSTRPVPILSAIAPANGWVSPHQSWPNANARLMLATPRPVDVLSGLRNSPIV